MVLGVVHCDCVLSMLYCGFTADSSLWLCGCFIVLLFLVVRCQCLAALGSVHSVARNSFLSQIYFLSTVTICILHTLLSTIRLRSLAKILNVFLLRFDNRFSFIIIVFYVRMDCRSMYLEIRISVDIFFEIPMNKISFYYLSNHWGFFFVIFLAVLLGVKFITFLLRIVPMRGRLV